MTHPQQQPAVADYSLQLAQLSRSDLLAEYEDAVTACTDRSGYSDCERVRLARREVAERMTITPRGAP